MPRVADGAIQVVGVTGMRCADGAGPFQEIAKMAGVEPPEYLGKIGAG